MSHSPDTLTWSALLARWTDFARSAVALPDSGPSGYWKQAVPHIIALQAVTHALGELATLEPAEIPLALDRASISIREAGSALQSIWSEEPLPPEAVELLDDSRIALRQARMLGFEWVVTSERLTVPHPGELASALADAELAAQLLMPTPGVPIFRTSPAAHFIPRSWQDERLEAALEGIDDFLNDDGSAKLGGLSTCRQVYRQFDFGKGGPVRDFVSPIEADLPAGQPLLIASIADGQVQPVTLPPRTPQRLDPLPVEFADE